MSYIVKSHKNKTNHEKPSRSQLPEALTSQAPRIVSGERGLAQAKA